MNTKRLLTIGVVILLTMLLVNVALAAPAAVSAETQAPAVDWLAVLFPPEFIKAAAGLLLVIVLDLALGISVAIQQKAFEWSKLADFYRAKVVPNLIGWAIADILLRVAVYYQLPILEQLQPLGAVGLYALAMASLLGQIGSKLAQLRGETSAS